MLGSDLFRPISATLGNLLMSLQRVLSILRSRKGPASVIHSSIFGLSTTHLLYIGKNDFFKKCRDVPDVNSGMMEATYRDLYKSVQSSVVQSSLMANNLTGQIAGAGAVEVVQLK